LDGDEFPIEKEGFFAKIKGMFAKPEVDDADMDLDVGGDFSDGDDFPAENEGFFAKIKGMFSKSAEIDDFEDRLLDDYKPVLAKDDGDVFDMSSSAAPAPAVAPKPKVVAPQAEPEFQAFEPKPVPVAKPRKEDDEFDLSASVPPPPPPLPVTLPPPVFNRIAHVCLHVLDLDASVAFYTKLGFKRRFAFNKNGGLFGVYLEFGKGNFIAIFKDTQRVASAARGSLAHFCLETPDIDAAIKSLASRGIQHTPKKLGSDRTYQIWLKDPDGNEFEIHQYTPESSQITGRDVEADW
jgi:catechol 2,3-dioxygenase-like lactoylglutathione lyase family enzyme